ncbi:MAG TPA: type II secretion system protein GspM [Candidatus Acidoferrales bacterium]|nr:type II secretion system protein GspM [Candidatus Acidoferrales bacterium]
MRRIWERLSRREKGLVVVALAILILVLGRFFLLDPFLARREWVKSEIELQPQHLAKNLRYLAQKKEIEAELEKSRGELKALEAVLLAGDTPSVSASNLQEILQTAAAKDGVQVITTRVLNPESMGPFTKIPIQVEIGGQLEQVVNLIRGLDSAEKLLVISELNIRSLFTPAGVRAQPGVAAAPAQNLRASLIVAGFARAPGSAGAEGARAKASGGTATAEQ